MREANRAEPSGQPGEVVRLHVVSQVVARRFCDQGHELTRFRIQYRTVRRAGPSATFVGEKLYPADVAAFERVWCAVEDQLPRVFDELDRGTILGSNASLGVLRECMAVHMARSRIIDEIDKRAVAKVRGPLVDKAAADARIIEPFRRRHHGIIPAGPEGMRIGAEEVVDEQIAKADQSAWTANRMLHWHPRAVQVLAGGNLEIVEAQQGELLIGDIPGLSLLTGHPGGGPACGVPWTRADRFYMPLGRHHGIVVTPQSVAGGARAPAWRTLTRGEVEELNEAEVRGAVKEIAWHPAADFRAFVESLLS
jgi:hypothetical protein